MYGVNTMIYAWFANHLNSRKQYIMITESVDTMKNDIKGGVSQGSILGPLLFLLYVNNLPNSSIMLVPKTKFLLFHKSSKKNSVFSHLPTSKMNNHDIERINTMKFLGVLLDDNLSWKKQIKYLENKIGKNIGIMYRAKPFLDKESFLALYYSYIHSNSP